MTYCDCLYNEMKYSLANKEFRKRNNIFGERRHPDPSQYIDHTHLDCINELGEDLEDSKSQHELLHDPKSDNVYRYIDFAATEFDSKEKNKQSFNRSNEGRAGRHGLSPNIKPSIPIVRTAPPISSISAKLKQPAKRHLSLQSNVIEFHHYSQDTEIELAELKQVLMKLYVILKKNNQRIAYLERLLQMLAYRSSLMLGQLGSCLSFAFNLDGKVDLFLNTMRNVYQNLRISRLKQENLQLYLKQTAPDQITPGSVQQPPRRKEASLSSHQQSFKETEELMSLLEYESDSSVVQPYLHRKQQIKRQTAKTQKYRHNEQIEDTIEMHRRAYNMKKEWQPTIKETFRVEQSNFERLSPFEANKLISNSAESFFYEVPKIHEQGRPIAIKQSPRSNMSYSFEASEFDKVRNWCRQRGEERMLCWLDDMGCLRRPNMTYIFSPSGEVMRLSQKAFTQLQSQGLIERCRENE